MRIQLTGIILAQVVMAGFPATALAADDTQAQLRAELELHRQEDQARRDMDTRDRMQAEALRGQEEAIRRMEATQSRLEANSQRLAQQSADQANNYNHPQYVYIAPVAPRTPGVSQPDRVRENAAVGAINFAPLSERLKGYFGPQPGVLVVSAGPDAPFGLQDGDVVVSIDGRVPADGPHAAHILRSYQPGERVKLRVQRDRRVRDIDAAAPGP